MTSTTTENIRLTISVSPEVHATFQRLSKAGNMSLSKAMGEWLADTVEAADFMASKMEQARAAPKIVMREMHAYALGLVDETSDLISRMKKGPAEAGGDAVAPRPSRAAPSPRPVIRGGKSKVKNHANGGKAQ